MSIQVRRARTADVQSIKAIVDIYAGSGRKLLAKELVALYEDVQDFRVAELDGTVSAAAPCTYCGPTSAKSGRWPFIPTMPAGASATASSASWSPPPANWGCPACSP